MKTIYELRARCKQCNLDKMINFYLPVPEATPKEMYAGHEQQFREEIFPEKYNCSHPIEFTHRVVADYKWDEVKQLAVAR